MSNENGANGNGQGAGRRGAESFELKVGLAEMMKNGVIMDVVDAEQAKIAEEAGACAVMALERVPSDIRKDGGVARMSAVDMIEQASRRLGLDSGDGQGPHRPHRRRRGCSRPSVWTSSTRARC